MKTWQTLHQQTRQPHKTRTRKGTKKKLTTKKSKTKTKSYQLLHEHCDNLNPQHLDDEAVVEEEQEADHPLEFRVFETKALMMVTTRQIPQHHDVEEASVVIVVEDGRIKEVEPNVLCQPLLTMKET